MSTALFHFTRNLKFSRFTIDVLIQRLEQFKARRSVGYERLLRETDEGVRNCDHMHKDLCDRFGGAQSFDARSIASLLVAFEVLNRRIMESIANCNFFEFGPSLRSA
jgi:hypothetical protein